MNKKLLFVSASLAGLALSFSRSAFAEDDLLSILSDEPKQEAPKSKAKVKSSESETAQTAKAIRKLIGSTSAEQNIFLDFYGRGQFEKALYQWPLAFSKSDFAKTPSGQALYAILLFQNGITVIGLENLLNIEHATSVAPALTEAWKNLAISSSPAWKYVIISKWNPGWTKVFGPGAEVRVMSRELHAPESLSAIKALLDKTQEGTAERAMMQWQTVIGLALKEDAKNNAGQAAQVLNQLMRAPANPIGTDLMNLTAARLLYQNGYLDAALTYDRKVAKSSDYWLDAQEEMAWAYLRKGEPQNALAVSQTLVHPAFKDLVGPEAIFVRSLAQLKVCDYPAVAETLKIFRERFKPRASELMKIDSNPSQAAVLNYLNIAKSKSQVTLKDIGEDATRLPRFITRDQLLQQLVATQAELEREAKTAGDLYARSLTGSSGEVGFQGRLEIFKQAVETRAGASRSASIARIKNLASVEIKEISQILQKMQIVEAEVIQQMALVDRVAKASATSKPTEQKGVTGSTSRDRVSFPAESEIWFDEISNFKVDLKKGCQALNNSGTDKK
jgi:hypothetical protein